MANIIKVELPDVSDVYKWLETNIVPARIDPRDISKMGYAEAKFLIANATVEAQKLLLTQFCVDLKKGEITDGEKMVQKILSENPEEGSGKEDTRTGGP